MKGWFRNLGGSSQQGSSARRHTGEADEATMAALARAEQLFRDLRVSVGADFRRLNEATKLVHQIEGAVMKMTNADTKAIWRSQVEELKRDLQSVTARMLAVEYAQDAASAQGYAPPSSPSPATTARVAVPTAQAATAAPSCAAATPPKNGAQLVEEGVVQGGDLFDGLDLGGLGDPLEGSTWTEVTSSTVVAEVPVSLPQTEASPLPIPPLEVDLGVGAPAAVSEATTVVLTVEADQPLPAVGVPLGGAPLDESLFCEGPADSVALPPLDLLSAADSGPPGPFAAPTAPGPGAPLTSLLDMGLLDSLPSITSATSAPSSDPLPAQHIPAAASTAPQGLGPRGPVPPSPAAAPGVRKKKVHKRIGYARGRQDDEDVVPGLPSTGSAPWQSQGSLSTVSSLTSAPATQGSLGAGPPAPPRQQGAPSVGLHSRASSLSSTSSSQAFAAKATSLAASATSAASRPADAGDTDRHATGHTMAHASAQVETALPSLPAMSEGAFTEQLAALQQAAQSAWSKLKTAADAAEAPERFARSTLRKCSGRMSEMRSQAEQLERQQGEAIEAEDFDRAAQIASQLDGLKTQQAWLEREIRAAENSCQEAAIRRIQLQAQQAEVWERAVKQVEQLVEQQAHQSQQALQQQDKLLSDLMDAEVAAAEHLTELRARIQAKSTAVKDQQAALDKKIAAATSGLHAERSEVQSRWQAVNQEVQDLRAALAAKEAELLEVEGVLEGVDERIAAASAKYDKSRSIVEEDQAALEADSARLAAEEASVEQLRSRQTAAQAQAAELEGQVKAQAAEGVRIRAALQAKASAIRAELETEQASSALLQQLRAEEEHAHQLLAERQDMLEGLQRDLKSVGAQRRAASSGIREVQERAQRAQRLLPDLEREKKAAAAARDFAEAKRLADEAKAAASDAAAAADEEAALTARVAQYDQQEQQLRDKQQELTERITSSQAAVGLARWRRMQAQMSQLRAQVSTAEQQELYDEAGQYQAEVEALAKDAEALAQQHGLTMAEHGQGLDTERGADGVKSSSAPHIDSTASDLKANVSLGLEKPLELPQALFDTPDLKADASISTVGPTAAHGNQSNASAPAAAPLTDAAQIGKEAQTAEAARQPPACQAEAAADVAEAALSGLLDGLQLAGEEEDCHAVQEGYAAGTTADRQPAEQEGSYHGANSLQPVEKGPQHWGRVDNEVLVVSPSLEVGVEAMDASEGLLAGLELAGGPEAVANETGTHLTPAKADHAQDHSTLPPIPSAADPAAVVEDASGLLDGLDIADNTTPPSIPTLAHTTAFIDNGTQPIELASEQSLDDLLAGLKLAGTEDLEEILSAPVNATAVRAEARGVVKRDQGAVPGPGPARQSTAGGGLLEGLEVMTASSMH